MYLAVMGKFSKTILTEQKKFQNVPGGGVTGLGIIGEENMACHTIKTAILIDALLWTLQYDSRRI